MSKPIKVVRLWKEKEMYKKSIDHKNQDALLFQTRTPYEVWMLLSSFFDRQASNFSNAYIEKSLNFLYANEPVTYNTTFGKEGNQKTALLLCLERTLFSS
jgi:hypothetical protein